VGWLGLRRARLTLTSRSRLMLLSALLTLSATFLFASAPLVMAPAAGTGSSRAQSLPPDPAALIEQARQSQMDGDSLGAADLYTRALQANAPDSTQVTLAAASAFLGSGQAPRAADLASTILTQTGPSSDAYILIAQASAQEGETQAAIDALEASLSLDSPAGYAAYRMAQLQASAGDAAAAEDSYNQAIHSGMATTWTVIAEHQAGLLALARNQNAEAVSWLELAERTAAPLERESTPSWFDRGLVRDASDARRAPILLDLANAYQANGQGQQMLATLVGIVSDYPSSKEGQMALSQLETLDSADLIPAADRGYALYFAGRYDEASVQLSAAAQDPTASDPASAAYYAALAEDKSGDPTSAEADLSALAAAFPDSSRAQDASWEAASLVEANDGVGAAIPDYLEIASDYPLTMLAGRALIHVAALRYATGDIQGAMAIWSQVGSGDYAARQRAQALYQLGRSDYELGDVPDGVEALNQAAELAPNSYEGLRAGDLAIGGPGSEPYSTSPATALQVPDLGAEDADCESILGAGDPSASVPTELALVDRLNLVGMPDAAVAEAMNALSQLSATRDLYELARGLQYRGLYAESIAAGQRLVALLPSDLSASPPPCVQSLLYPAAYGDLIQAEATRDGVDPYLLLAVFRQESWLSARAHSPTDAQGVAQIEPSTAASIASALGDPAPGSSDLYRPEVAIRYGASYLSMLLRQFGGRAIEATAAYNAGPGAAGQWLSVAADPDDFVEAIDYAETSTYVRAVYEQYREYRALYG